MRSVVAAARRRRSAPALFAIVSAIALAGCGSDAESTVDEAAQSGQEEAERAATISSNIDASDVVEAFPPTIVKDGDVTAAKPDSPERALLEWWQAFQFGDAIAVIELTSERTLKQIGEEEVAAAAKKLGLPGLAILGASEAGRSAEVRVGMLNFAAGESGTVPKKPTSSQPEAFTMRREGDRWLFDDTEYLQLRVDAALGS